jgi:hypothetical protein
MRGPRVLCCIPSEQRVGSSPPRRIPGRATFFQHLTDLSPSVRSIQCSDFFSDSPILLDRASPNRYIGVEIKI